MGTVNYKTSDYITIGVKPYDYNDFIGYFETDEQIYDEIASCYEDDLDNIKTILNKYRFLYYHITIEPGYYEGFSLMIENNYSIAFDDYTDKREALKELTVIKQCLIDCCGCGLVVCYPSWCTGYEDYNKSVEIIKQTIKDMKEEVKNTPTWRQYLIDCGEW